MMEQNLFDQSILDEDFLYELDFSPPVSPCFGNASPVDTSKMFEAGTPLEAAPAAPATPEEGASTEGRTKKHVDANSVSKIDAEHQHNAWLDAQFSRERDDIPATRQRRSSPIEVDAEAIHYEDLVQFPHIVHVSPIQPSLNSSMDRGAVEYQGPVVYTNAVETVAVHVIFADSVFNLDKLPWLPSYSSGSAPTDVRVYSDVSAALCHIVQCHQRANATLVEMGPQHFSAPAPTCHYLYILVVNTSFETSKAPLKDSSDEWNHQWVLDMCQGVENTISGPATATIRVLRAGDVTNENGVITEAMFDDQQMRRKIARQVAQNLNSMSPDMLALTDDTTDVTDPDAATNCRGGTAGEMADDAGVLSQFTRDNVTTTSSKDTLTFVLRPQCSM